MPNPEDWNTPRHMYFSTNMFAPLPDFLENDGKFDTLFTLKVGDKVCDEAEQIKEIRLQIALSDPVTRAFKGRTVIKGRCRKFCSVDAGQMLLEYSSCKGNREAD